MKKRTEAWLDAAKEDIVVVESIKSSELATGASSFHAQQCVEKSLKAVLEEYSVKVPRIHDLEKLFQAADQFLKIEFDEDIVDKLNSVYIESRYPGAFGFLPQGKPTLKDVNEFYEFAMHIFEIVKIHFSYQ